MAQLTVEIRDKSFADETAGPRRVLSGVRFAVAPGERVAIIGPSGCGKTTLLNIVAGLDRRFEGRTAISGGGRIGYVFQEPRLLLWRTVADNLRLVLHGAEREITGRVARVLDEVGLAGEERTFASHLSLGMARRVAIARALAVEPALLLLDEPFVSLDEPTAQRLRQLVLDLLDRHPTTTLFVTHNLREAIMLAERLLVLSAAPARIVADLPVPLSPDQRRRGEAIEDMRRALAAEGLAAFEADLVA